MHPACEGLSPQEWFEHFGNLLTIPRQSGNEDKVREFCRQTAFIHD